MIRTPKLRLLVATTAIALAGTASAASLTDLHGQDVARLNQSYRAATQGLGVVANAHARHAELLGLDNESSLQVLTQASDKDGTTHYRYQQTFRGIPVFGEQIIVSERSDGSVKNLFGNKVDNLGAELPALSFRVPQTRALALGKTAGMGERASALRTENESANRIIFVDDNGRAHPAYLVSYFADAPQGGQPTRPFVILDANTGKVLKQWEGLTHAAIGTGPGGNTKTGQYEWGSGGKYGFLDVAQSGTTCTMSNTDVKSVNLNGSTGTSTTAFAYTCPRNTTKTINGGFAPINDAHYFGGVIQNMYQSYTGGKALTFQLIMRVHYSSNYENAFWNGSNMSFGDGATTFYPLVNADVSGHEVSHGYTEQHSNLTYSGMSGGMNEAFSDMGGEATEYFWQGSNDFLVGPEIFKGTGALRYMANPPQDGRSIDNAANYTSSLDVHYSSGVYNKAFYLLATKAGWNTKMAFQVMARANATYWTASSTFNQGACGVETAATDLGYTKADVTAAFSSVGVACATSTPPPTSGGTLSNGVTVSNLSAATGADVNYTMVVPAGASSLKFVMSGGTGDADMYVKFGSAPTSTVYDCRPYTSGNAETCTIATAQAGTYYVRLNAYAAFSGVSLTGSYSTSTTPTTQTYTNGTDVAIPDNNSTGVTSSISVSGRTGNGATSTPVKVSILHPYSGDLVVDLIAPDGSVYNISNRAGGSADNIVKTVNINLSGEALNGTWKLRAKDLAAADVGKIDSWSITF